MDTRPSEHLTDSELFSLAAPASGEPQPLPAHLSRCEPCTRALQEWRAAMQTLGREDVAEIERRPAEDWDAARDATMAAIRRSRPRRVPQTLRWAAGVAAAVLLVLLAMPARKAAPVARPPADDMALATAADRDDDRLLREAEYLAQGGDDPVLTIEESL